MVFDLLTSTLSLIIDASSPADTSFSSFSGKAVYLLALVNDSTHIELYLAHVQSILGISIGGGGDGRGFSGYS